MATEEYLARIDSLLKIRGGLLSQLQKDGKFPPMRLYVKSLASGQTVMLDKFLSYNFSNSMLVPVDTFSFAFSAPDNVQPFNEVVKDGDIALLEANGITISVGIIDRTEIATETEGGEMISVSGRNLLGQFDDQDMVSVYDTPVWGDKMTVDQAVRRLCENTRIQPFGVQKQDCPTKPYLFATEPGESKMAAFQRYCEPLNILFWMGPDGSLVVGRPNFAQGIQGRLVLSKQQRTSNVIAMTVTRGSTQIANVVVPIWTGQETTTEKTKSSQRAYNKAEGPTRLRKHQHLVPKTVVVSTPQGGAAQDLAEANKLMAYGGNILQWHAKREIARQNVNEMQVQSVAAGHYNEKGAPYLIDTVYRIDYDRGSVLENMYLYAANYYLDEGRGQRTTLYFCRLNTIVSDSRAP